ncbi:SpaH/EbpB family LPXTG-anchored major pilin [Leucobacter iarius]|uniref:SpaH/EbpB family LPXTG-anchored major pilin n=1 Tax=Leucobacter iarius TaxID=333963 RepID=A0ABP4XRW4_9MICO
MNRNDPSRGRRLLAATAAFTVGLAGVLALGATANAAPVSGPITAQNGSITIHKHANPGFSSPQNPDGTQGAGGSPLQGVSFEVCSIAGIDLIGGGNAAWDAVNALGGVAKDVKNTDTTISGRALACKPVQRTAADGTTTFAGLPVGAYLVRETDKGANPITQTAAPFVVTVPTPAIGADAGKWLYDVNVYPKNQLGDAPVKNLADQPTNGVILGDKIGFTVSQKVPAIAAGDTYKKFRVLDALDPALKHTSDAITVSSSGTALVAADYTASWMGETLVASLTPSGLAKIKAGDTITIGFTATALKNGVITNIAWANVNDLVIDSTNGPTPPTDPENPTNPGNPGNPTNVVETRWGAVDLKKVNAATNEGLQGAKFDLYMVNAATCPATLAGAGTKVGSYTSGAGGVVTVPGLWVGDTRTVNGAKPYDTNTRCYYLVETAAPAGFVTDGTPRGFVVHPGATAHADATKAIPNSQQLVPGLPLTGSDGQLILLIGGIALLIAAAGGALILRRRSGTDSAV